LNSHPQKNDEGEGWKSHAQERAERKGGNAQERGSLETQKIDRLNPKT